MKSKRHTEYNDFIESAYDYPDELNHMTSRLHTRIRKRIRRRILTSISSFIIALLLFTTAINGSTVFAQMIDNIPVISSLVQYLKFDRGLQNAIQNKYIQEVNLEETVNGYTLKMPYAIADEKRLVVFFQLPDSLLDRYDDENFEVTLDNSIWDQLDIKSFYYKRLTTDSNQPTGLHVISIRFGEGSIPKDITLPISLSKSVSTYITDDFLSRKLNKDPTNLASYEFKLHLNDYEKSKTTVLNQEIKVLDGNILLHSVTEFATGVEVKFKARNDGKVSISGLEIKGIDEKGNVWTMPENESFVAFFADNYTDFIYYLDNDYFSDIPLASLEITRVGMYPNSEKKIVVDLLEKTMTPAISNMIIKSVQKKSDLAYITFESDTPKLNTDEIFVFSDKYEDMQGNVYFMENYQSSEVKGSKTKYNIIVNWAADNKVVLERYISYLEDLDEPIKIPLPK